VTTDPAGRPDAAGEVAEAHPGAQVSEHHADVSGGWLRPAVFGAMDGLVSNVGLIAGVGGGGLAPRTIILAGFAGLVAGAISMALGEYTSVKTQAEQVEAEVARERRELERNPEIEQDELAHLWMARGLPSDLAHEVARVVHASPAEALRVHVREELGVDPSGQPSPWTAALSSFVCFAVGAFVPIVPYLVGFGELWIALAAGGSGLFATGALAARFTRRRWWFSGLRQLALGVAAAAITFLIGHLIGNAAGSL
jgi:VIT1/CCC1 family predicted Fe2+/Mn2+ transporter